MEFKIRGEVLQVVDIQLKAGESVYTERGGMGWMTPNISMETNARGGLGKSIGRMFSGESFFLTTYAVTEGNGLISFCNEFPGKIIPLNLAQGEKMICQKDAFMVAQNTVQLETKFSKRFSAGLFGGEGFILQQISGPGQAFVEIAGEVTEYELEKDQVLKVDPGHIAMMTDSIDFDIVRVKGLKNVLFGGEGLFLATVKGPGKVWLQSMPVSALAMKIIPYLPKKELIKMGLAGFFTGISLVASIFLILLSVAVFVGLIIAIIYFLTRKETHIQESAKQNTNFKLSQGKESNKKE